jgi:hypothetical protein
MEYTDELEPVNGPFDWALATIQELERVIEFIRSCPEVVRPAADIADVVADAADAMKALDEMQFEAEEWFGDGEDD